MPVAKLKQYLDKNGIKYVSIFHSPAYTAQEVAARVHVQGKKMAKTVMIKVDGKMTMAVLPASRQIDFDYLRKEIGAARWSSPARKNSRTSSPDAISAPCPRSETFTMIDVLTDDSIERGRRNRIQRGDSHRTAEAPLQQNTRGWSDREWPE